MTSCQSNCKCQGGSCEMPACTTNCKCQAGGCPIPKCGHACKCQAGRCNGGESDYEPEFVHDTVALN